MLPVGFAGTLLLIWQLASDTGLVAGYMLPSPCKIASTLATILPDIRGHLTVTLRESLTGFALAVILAVMLAAMMDNIAFLRKAVYPLLVVSQTVPIILLAPLFALWFGFGEFPRIIVVVLVCFFPVAVNLLEGMKSVDPDMINLFKSMGADRIQIFRHLKFPASLINFFSGLRIAATYSIMAAVIGEWMGGKSGLGVYMLRVKHSYAMAKVFAVIVIVVILSIMLFYTITLVQRLCMPWHTLAGKKR